MESDHRFAQGHPAKRGHPRAVKGLADAQALAKAHPETFGVPPAANLKRIKPGDFVKVARNGERFWVKVTGFEKRRIHGVVDNDLMFNDDLPVGQGIYFQKKHIYSWLPEEEATF
jgi:hypothetical protein